MEFNLLSKVLSTLPSAKFLHVTPKDGIYFNYSYMKIEVSEKLTEDFYNKVFAEDILYWRRCLEEDPETLEGEAPEEHEARRFIERAFLYVSDGDIQEDVSVEDYYKYHCAVIPISYEEITDIITRCLKPPVGEKRRKAERLWDST